VRQILQQRTADMKGRGEPSSPGLAYPGPNRQGPPGHRLGSGRAYGRPVRENGWTWHIRRIRAATSSALRPRPTPTGRS